MEHTTFTHDSPALCGFAPNSDRQRSFAVTSAFRRWRQYMYSCLLWLLTVVSSTSISSAFRLTPRLDDCAHAPSKHLRKLRAHYTVHHLAVGRIRQAALLNRIVLVFIGCTRPRLQQADQRRSHGQSTGVSRRVMLSGILSCCPMYRHVVCSPVRHR